MKSKPLLIKHFKEKIKEIQKHNHFYYNNDKPKISDADYDKLKKEITQLEENYEFLKSLKLLDDLVGAAPTNKFKKIKHESPMLSLANAFNKENMKDFIAANKGLASRFKRNIVFENYNDLELYQIFYKMCRENNFMIANDANRTIKEACKKVIEITGKRYSNARDVRRFFEGCIQSQSVRLSLKKDKTKMDLMMIKKEDIETTINNFS